MWIYKIRYIKEVITNQQKNIILQDYIEIN